MSSLAGHMMWSEPWRRLATWVRNRLTMPKRVEFLCRSFTVCFVQRWWRSTAARRSRSLSLRCSRIWRRIIRSFILMMRILWKMYFCKELAVWPSSMPSSQDVLAILPPVIAILPRQRLNWVGKRSMASRKCAEIAGTGRRITRTGMRGKWLLLHECSNNKRFSSEIMFLGGVWSRRCRRFFFFAVY